jgi:choline dehydrogenase-like flavoprotein
VIYIIGSGLSGLAAAVALIKRGFRPTILDAGLTPDSAASSVKTRLASMEPEFWAAEDLQRMKETGPPSRNGIPQKLAFGSDFAYRDIDSSTTPALNHASIRRSFALGGFSNVWGAVIQPLASGEFDHWPIDESRLSSHYAAILDLMCSGAKGFVNPSSQARALYADMASHGKQLEAAGIRFDYAQLAVRSADDDQRTGCRSCGLCLYGCPYDSIFEAGTALSRFVRQGLVSHVPNVVVDRVTAAGAEVRIEGRSATDGNVRIFNGSSVFIAAGLLETVRIVLNSTGAKNRSVRPLRIQTSDIFTLPMVHYSRSRGVSAERLHTLCQLMVNVDDREISEHPVHLQLYGYNDLYPHILADKLGLLSAPFKAATRSIAERLFVAFGYLHSRVSSTVDITPPPSDTGRLLLTGRENPEGRRVADAVVRKLFQNRRFLRMLPITPQLQFDLPGGSVRNGACFPMRRDPEGLETDVWGSVHGLRNVHLIDASVLPAIPAGPIAFTVMANAHRVASECPIEDVQ